MALFTCKKCLRHRCVCEPLTKIVSKISPSPGSSPVGRSPEHRTGIRKGSGEAVHGECLIGPGSLLNEEEKNVARQAIRGFTISRGID
jgi:hypothetical protein